MLDRTRLGPDVRIDLLAGDQFSEITFGCLFSDLELGLQIDSSERNTGKTDAEKKRREKTDFLK